MSEAKIIINGVELTEIQSSVVRIAIQSASAQVAAYDDTSDLVREATGGKVDRPELAGPSKQAIAEVASFLLTEEK